MKTKFVYSESKLSQVTGISRAELIELRNERLEKGRDWRRSKTSKGRPIELTEYAIGQLLDGFDLRDTDIRAALIKGGDATCQNTTSTQESSESQKLTSNAAPTSDPNSAAALHELKVSFIPGNIRMLRAENDKGDSYDVIVPNNKVFSLGDPLRAKESPQSGYLELTSSPPRWKSDRLYRVTEGFE